MSEAVTPERYAEEMAKFALHWIPELKAKGLTESEALLVTGTMMERLFPTATPPVSPDLLQLYERMGTSMARVAEIG